MSIGGIAKTTADSIYAYRFIRLMQKSFEDWEAFRVGVIDNKGNVLKRPKTEEEKSAYTPFHASIRAMKRMMATVPGATTMATISSSLSAIGSRFGLTESDWSLIATELDDRLYESMVAGDAGDGSGSAKSIASGETTGAITNLGAGGAKKRKLVNLNKL